MRPGILKGLAFALVLLLAPAAQAQPENAQKGFTPQVGQAGKDVIWVPTPDSVAKAMLQLAKVGPRDFVMDLGSGDGRIAINAGKLGARALGIEYNPNMVELSRKAAAAAGVTRMVQFRQADIFATDISRATVITLYLLPDLNMRLRPRLLEMRPGTRVVSHSFNMDDWEPDQTTVIDDRSILMWTVPAKVAGAWSLRQSGSAIHLFWTQKFQKIEGAAKAGERRIDVQDSSLAGDLIRFALVADGERSEYAGMVSGKSMRGTLVTKGRDKAQWSARRI